MFTKPDGGHLAPEYITSHMQVIAKRVGLCCAVVRDTEPGATTLVVGHRHADPVGTWTVYVDRQPVGQVTVTGCQKRRGSGATLTLAEPLAAGLPSGAELGRDLLSRRRLHDMRQGSASISLAEGVDLTLVSKRLGHSSPHVTAKLYAHLLRSTGQAVAEKVEAAVPRRKRSAQPPPSDLEKGAPAGSRIGGDEVNMQVTDLGTGGPCVPASEPIDLGCVRHERRKVGQCRQALLDCGAVWEMRELWPLGAARRVGGFKPPRAALADDCGGERRGKGAP
jgi:hypothetical protein